MARVADADPAQHLDPLGDQVDELELLLGVLVEQQVQLVEGRAGDVPVVLLVQRVQDRRVGEDLVEQPAALDPRVGAERDRLQPNVPEPLELPRPAGGANLGERRPLVVLARALDVDWRLGVAVAMGASGWAAC